MDLAFNTKVIQHSNQGHYGVYIFENLFTNEYLNILLNKTLELTEVDSMNRKTNVHANMTNYQALINDKDFFIFMDKTKSFLKTCIMIRTPHWRNDPAKEFVDCWGMQFKKGESTAVHTHIGQFWSGVFCIRSEDETKIVFPDLSHAETIKSNTLYLFPGIMPHFTTEYTAEIPRVALAFNIMINQGEKK